MIIGSIDKGATMKFYGKALAVLYLSVKKTVVNCTLRDEKLNQIFTKTFRRIGGDIKSGIDLGDCQEYIPAKTKSWKLIK